MRYTLVDELVTCVVSALKLSMSRYRRVYRNGVLYVLHGTLAPILDHEFIEYVPAPVSHCASDSQGTDT